MKELTTVMLFLLLTACSISPDAELTKEENNSAVRQAEDTRCALSPDPGPCKAYFKRYYFDSTEGKCKEFIWGGCDGVVPFETMDECKECVKGI